MPTPARRKTDNFWEGKARSWLVAVGLAFTTGGAEYFRHAVNDANKDATMQRAEVDNLRADRSRYEDLQQHCNERELDYLRRAK